MNKENENMDWEKDAPQLAAIKVENCFNVPVNYFENLSEQITNQIKLAEIADQNLGFKTPNGYFDSLEEQIFAKINLEEKLGNSSANHQGFNIPENYFEPSKLRIEKALPGKKQSLRKILTINFIRFAAAACILLTTSVGIYFNIQRTSSIHYKLSRVSDEEIETYLNQNIEAADMPILLQNLENKPVFTIEQNQLSNDEIKNYLDLTN